MTYSTDKLLLAAKVLELSVERQRKAAEVAGINSGISADEIPAWVGNWLKRNPRENFVQDVLEDLADIVDIIEARSR